MKLEDTMYVIDKVISLKLKPHSIKVMFYLLKFGAVEIRNLSHGQVGKDMSMSRNFVNKGFKELKEYGVIDYHRCGKTNIYRIIIERCQNE